MTVYRSLDVPMGHEYKTYPELYVTGNTPFMSYTLKSANGQEGVYYVPDLYETKDSDMVEKRTAHSRNSIEGFGKTKETKPTD